MNEIMMVDIYQIRSSYSLDEICLKSLYQLYQPIVGHQAITLYITMWSELSWLTLTKSPALISRLTKLADLSIQSLNQQVCKLEAIGLMNTYVRTNPGRRYLFDLKYPLTPQHVFQHQVLNSLLKQKLGQEDYQKTFMNFRTFDVNKEEYQEITHSFSDVFDVYLGQEEGLIDKNVYSKKVNHIEDEYDLTLFYQGLENLQISKKMINQNDELLITFERRREQRAQILHRARCAEHIHRRQQRDERGEDMHQYVQPLLRAAGQRGVNVDPLPQCVAGGEAQQDRHDQFGKRHSFTPSRSARTASPQQAPRGQRAGRRSRRRAEYRTDRRCRARCARRPRSSAAAGWTRS